MLRAASPLTLAHTLAFHTTSTLAYTLYLAVSLSCAAYTYMPLYLYIVRVYIMCV